ncbi:MAG: 4-(cytidine 5'-diphospho)-2-C-methyl-D-erythritol kinase [Lachnospiraceae bacterium]|nr:4-(cytidine 5'-diphospho)-2-C-methyl-D-erythritol kinase [Lachnospiraceae bacterium]
MKRIIKAPAKINLCLKVNGKRDDGYHDLSMVMQEISLFDTMEFEIVSEKDFDIFRFLPKFDIPIKLPELPKIDIDFLNQFFVKKFDYDSDKQINLRSNYGYIPTDEKNLVYKVIKYIFDKYGIKDKIYIFLKKMIPTSGGLGGGSSDAASMLLFLDRHYKLKLGIDELNAIAAMFGSDIPFFVHKKVSICEGRGEIVKELRPYNNYYILIATPNVRVSTREIFSRVDKYSVSDERKKEEDIKFLKVLEAIKERNIYKLSDNIFNDLEIVTEPMFEKVGAFKKRIKELGAITSLMSGSGPTVFGIFNSYFKVLNCKNVMKKENRDSFIFIARPI